MPLRSARRVHALVATGLAGVLLTGCVVVGHRAASPRRNVPAPSSPAPSSPGQTLPALTVPTPTLPASPARTSAPAEPSAVPTTIARTTAVTTPPAGPVSPPAGVPPAPTSAPATVAALAARITPDVFAQAPRSLTAADVQKVLLTTHGTSATLVDVGAVSLGKGSTTALGVNPSRFRPYAPQGTAESTPLWQRVAGGDVAVAHTVAAALAVPLGGRTAIAADGHPGETFRVGALATTGLPGVGVVVDDRYAADLGLLHDAALLIAAPGSDPVVTAALVQQALGDTVRATPLRVPTTGDGRLTWVPPAVGPITQGFGAHANPLASDGRSGFHPGIDIGATFGAPIYAACAGTVVYAGPAQGFGNEVVLQHAGQVQTVYGHMERILVAAGAPVAAGQPIALVGSEGESTGPHLHFEVHIGGALTDPLVWLEQHGVKVSR